MNDYTIAEKFSILKHNNYHFKAVGNTVEWWWQGYEYVWGGKCANMDVAIEQAFEEWEKGV